MSLLGTSGASEPGAPKASPHPPTGKGSRNKCICCKQPLSLPSRVPRQGRGHRSPLWELGGRGCPWSARPWGAGQPCPPLPCPAREVLASLPLQMLLYFNAYFSPVWCLAEGMMLQLKVPSQGVWGASPLLPGRPGHAGTTLRRGEGSRFEMKGSPRM